MDINKKTLKKALDFMKKQYEYTKSEETATESQQAYYNGLLTMLDLIVSDGYTLQRFVSKNPNTGIHEVSAGDWYKAAATTPGIL